MTQPLNDLAREVHETAAEKGWWPENEGTDIQMVFTRLMLVVTEVAEVAEAWRAGEGQFYSNGDGSGKPEGYGVELADCIIRLFDLMYHFNVDVDAVVRTKMEYNKTRSFRHGDKRA